MRAPIGQKRSIRGNRGQQGSAASQLAMLWVLNLSDGNHSLLDISERSGLPYDLIRGTAESLVKADLLVEAKRKS